jgi:hypothetical protein
MPKQGLTSVYFKFPATDQQKITSFFRKDAVAFSGLFTVLLPTGHDGLAYGLAETYDLAIMDKIEEELLGQELPIEEFNRAARHVGIHYKPCLHEVPLFEERY